jgi:hypothetical protein
MPREEKQHGSIAQEHTTASQKTMKAVFVKKQETK